MTREDRINDAGTELRKALEPSERSLWESINPQLPWDITLEEAERVVIVNGRAHLHPSDVAARQAALKVAA